MSIEQPFSLPSPHHAANGSLQFLQEIVPVDLICGISRGSFAHLQYFFYAATCISAIVWALVPVSGYIPITLLFISVILFGYPQSISSVDDRIRGIPEVIAPEAERYGTYNILCPAYRSKSPSFQTVESREWEYRKAHVFQNITGARLDVLAIQEITPLIFEELGHRLPLVGKYQGHGTVDQHLRPDGVAIFYNTHKFELLKEGRISNPVTQRICLYVDLKNRSSDRVTRFAAFHLDGNPHRPEVGDEQLTNILATLPTEPTNQYEIDRYVLAADFNAEMASEEPSHRKNMIQLDGYYRISNREETEIGTGARLDDVFVKQPNARLSLRPLGIHDQPIGSDHNLTGCHADPMIL